MLLLSTDGTIFLYSLLKDTAILEEIITSQEIKDASGNTVKSSILCMELFEIEPPKVDKCCFGLQEEEARVPKFEDDEWLFFGMDRGQLMVCNIRNLTKVHYRDQIAKSSVLRVKELKTLDSFLCLSADLILSLIKFRGDAFTVYQEVQMYRPVSDMMVFDN